MNVRELISQGQAMDRAGQSAAALELYKKALQRDKQNIELMVSIAEIHIDTGYMGDARKMLNKAYDLSKEPRLAARLAWVLMNMRRLDDAYRVLDRAIAARPGLPMLLGAKSQILYYDGRADEAMRTLAPVFNEAANSQHVAVALSHLTKKFGRTEEAIELLKKAVDNPSLFPDDRLHLRFRLIDLYDHLGRYDEAWVAAEEANRLVDMGFDPLRIEQDVDRLINEWDRERVDTFLRPATVSNKPVFIVGMPRSGSTLAEQVLGAHAEIQPGDETAVIPDLTRMIAASAQGAPGVRTVRFDQPDIDKYAKWLIKAYDSISKGSARVTDKLLDNVMHLGVISMLLPEAAVIRTKRNPLDTGVSCFFHQFHGTVNFIYDLHHLGAYSQQIDRLFDHWRSVLPIRIYDLEYEKLVADQERVTRELLGFLGLEWDESCMRFFESKEMRLTSSVDQVRRPMNSASVERWRHYEAHLGPLRAALGESAT